MGTQACPSLARYQGGVPRSTAPSSGHPSRPASARRAWRVRSWSSTMTTVSARSSSARSSASPSPATASAPSTCWRQTLVDCLLLDAGLPGLEGLEVCRRLRDAGDETPIILLTAPAGVGQRVQGLEAGADDCLGGRSPWRSCWPGSGRCCAGAGASVATRCCAWATWPWTACRWRCRGAAGPSTLTRGEFELLLAFMRRPRQVLRREELLSRVWGYDFATDTNVVEVYVLYLRRKLEAGGEPGCSTPCAAPATSCATASVARCRRAGPGQELLQLGGDLVAGGDALVGPLLDHAPDLVDELGDLGPLPDGLLHLLQVVLGGRLQLGGVDLDAGQPAEGLDQGRARPGGGRRRPGTGAPRPTARWPGCRPGAAAPRAPSGCRPTARRSSAPSPACPPGRSRRRCRRPPPGRYAAPGPGRRRDRTPRPPRGAGGGSTTSSQNARQRKSGSRPDQQQRVPLAAGRGQQQLGRRPGHLLDGAAGQRTTGRRAR